MTTGEDQRIVRELAAALESGRAVVLATVVATSRSVPRHAGSKMLVYRDGPPTGTVGGGAMESRVIDESRRAMLSGRPRLLTYELVDPGRGDPGVCGGEMQIYLEPYMPPHTVLVVGCGHVGRAVVDLAHWLGYRTVAADDRPEQVSAEALPNADVRFHGTVAEALVAHDVGDDWSVVVVTRSVDHDLEAIPHLLGTPAQYIGVMGSRRRWRQTRQRLVESGIAEAQLERIHVPIGLDLRAETPEEIAVSILSEVIMINRAEVPVDGEPDSAAPS